MKMVIKNIECNNNHIYVTADTGVGSIKGIWNYSEFPILDKAYYVELNIEELDRSKILVTHAKQCYPSVNANSNQVLFKGICEVIDDIYVIRFAVDWIEMISIENDDFSIREGDIVSFSTSCENISIYPYEL